MYAPRLALADTPVTAKTFKALNRLLGNNHTPLSFEEYRKFPVSKQISTEISTLTRKSLGNDAAFTTQNAISAAKQFAEKLYLGTPEAKKCG